MAEQLPPCTTCGGETRYCCFEHRVLLHVNPKDEGEPGSTLHLVNGPTTAQFDAYLGIEPAEQRKGEPQ